MINAVNTKCSASIDFFWEMTEDKNEFIKNNVSSLFVKNSTSHIRHQLSFLL